MCELLKHISFTTKGSLLLNLSAEYSIIHSKKIGYNFCNLNSRYKTNIKTRFKNRFKLCDFYYLEFVYDNGIAALRPIFYFTIKSDKKMIETIPILTSQFNNSAFSFGWLFTPIYIPFFSIEYINTPEISKIDKHRHSFKILNHDFINDSYMYAFHSEYNNIIKEININLLKQIEKEGFINVTI